MATTKTPANIDLPGLNSNDAQAQPPAASEGVKRLRELASHITAGIDSVRVAAAVALDDLEALRRAAHAAAYVGTDAAAKGEAEFLGPRFKIEARFAELCTDVAQAESVKVAKLEEELVQVDTRLALAEGSGGAGSEWIDPEPTEPCILRVVATPSGDDQAVTLAVLCAPRAVLASDVVVNSVPKFALMGSAPSGSSTAGDIVGLDLGLRDSYAYRCLGEADAALSYIARRVQVAAYDSTDPTRAQLSTHATFDAIRRVVSVAVDLPPSFDPSPDRAIVVGGVFLRGDPITESDLMGGFPLRIRSLPSEPLEVMKQAYIRVGRWNVGRGDGCLVFWNDAVEGEDGWELGEYPCFLELRSATFPENFCGLHAVEWMSGSNGWYRFEIGKQKYIFWSSGPSRSDQDIQRPWKTEKRPFVVLSLDTVVRFLEDPLVCEGNTRLLRYDSTAATFTMCNVGGHARTFSTRDGTAAADDDASGVIMKDPRGKPQATGCVRSVM